MTRARALIAFGLATCALAATTAPALATFLILLAEGTKELATKIFSETKGSEEEFAAGGGIFKCEENSFYGTEELRGDETNKIRVLPVYHAEKKGCTAEGVLKESGAEVHHNGCTYTFIQVNKGEDPEQEPYEGDTEVLCEGSNEIEIITNLLGCVIFVGKTNNQSIPGIDYLNLPEKKPLDIHITADALGIDFHTGSTCVGLEKEGRTGTYKAAPVLVLAHNSAGTTLAIHVDPFNATK